MFSFFGLFGGAPPVLDIEFNLCKNSYGKEISKQQTVIDRDYILLAFLVYARVIKITPFANKFDREKLYWHFIKMNEGVKSGAISWGSVEKASAFCCSHYGKPHAWRVKLNGTTIKTSSSINKEIEQYIHLSFIHSSSKIHPDNRVKMLEGFARLSESFLKERPSSRAAIREPYDILMDLFTKEMLGDILSEGYAATMFKKIDQQ